MFNLNLFKNKKNYYYYKRRVAKIAHEEDLKKIVENLFYITTENITEPKCVVRTAVIYLVKSI